MTEVKAEFERNETLQRFGFLNDNPPLSFYRGTVACQTHGFFVFASENTIKVLDTLPKRLYHADGTFSVAPQGAFKQVLVIHIEIRNHVSFNMYTTILVMFL